MKSQSKVSQYTNFGLGPWKQQNGDNIIAQLYIKKMKQVQNNKKQVKFPQMSPKKISKFHPKFPLKIQQLHLQKEEESIFKKNTKTISFDPPMISFYNKYHPKLKKYSLSNRYEEDLDSQLSILGRIQILENNQSTINDQARKTIRKQFRLTKKNSLIQLLKQIQFQNTQLPIFSTRPLHKVDIPSKVLPNNNSIRRHQYLKVKGSTLNKSTNA